MQEHMRWALAAAGMVCLASMECLAWQSFPAPEQQQGKERPAQQDAGFARPEMATPSDFPAKSERAATANALITSAGSRFSLAATKFDLRVPEAAAFRMHAVVTPAGGAEGGTYDELWLAPNRWRREVVLGSAHVVESREGDLFYRKVSGAEYAPRVADDVLDALGLKLPKPGGTFVEADWQQGSVIYDKTSTLRIAKGFGSTPPGNDAQAYWLDTDSRVRAAYENEMTVEFSDYEDFEGKPVARHVDVKDNGSKVAGIWIDRLASSADAKAQFAIEGVTPMSLADEAAYSGPYFVAPHPVHQVSPKDPPAGEGTVIVEVHLDAHGHVRAAKVKQGVNAGVDEAATRAALEWEFSPALLKGRPVASDATVQFSF